jgi:hypothetical protein
MLNIDDWRVMYEAQEQDMAKLRASLHDLEKRHEEAKLSLEVAQRERDTAEQMLRDCRTRCERMKTMEGLSIDECAARQLWAEQSRDAALAQAARLREALQYAKGQFDSHAGEDYASSVCAAALAHPGPSLAEIKAEALADVANFSTHTITLYDERGWCYTKPVVLVEAILAEAARLRGGGA